MYKVVNSALALNLDELCLLRGLKIDAKTQLFSCMLYVSVTTAKREGQWHLIFALRLLSCVLAKRMHTCRYSSMNAAAFVPVCEQSFPLKASACARLPTKVRSNSPVLKYLKSF